ncbi:DDHD domain containing 1 [Rhinolophus ferrumequinum]|uniref:DDHD domain containing 1 n=1 Tax=Rhinolophus ferrumequinum TaxID=59479 RepID=A0A7J7XN66_RHIFE|nr:DDHD domain containing 1 [Rhinolophus ferrumequinum]
MNYPGHGSPRSPELNGRGSDGAAWELGSEAEPTFGGSVCCFDHLPGGDPGDGEVPLALLRGEPGLHLAPGAEENNHHLALDPCLSDENYDFSSAESGSSLRFYSEGESGGGGSSSSLHPPQQPLLVPSNSGGGGAGGLYEVDVTQGECYPVYWNQADKIPVMRGQWFIDGTWQPLEEEESNLIEQEHLRCFRGQQMQESFDIEVSKSIDGKEAVHSFKLSRNHVDWHSVDEVYLYSDATTSKIARTVTQKLGFSKASSSGTRLHRGYVEEATLEDKPSQTTHIVFVVHGIGQKMDQGRIIKNTAMMREAARKIEERHFSNHATHVEFLPVEWRSKLTLDGDTVDSITPDKVRGLRDMLNSSAMDIMYYTSPLYRDELVKGLQQELNRLYSLFCSRNPDFEEKGGKVSIVSHSLGCVITYDIMTGWNPVRLYEQLLQKEEELPDERWMTYEERHLLDELYITKRRLREIEERLHGLKASSMTQTPALKFKVENFFCMGSPLAVFLALRGIRPGNSGSQDHILPREICNRLLNIFHPTDPVAYRLEPLILKHYSNISPVQIHWYNTSNPLPYEHMKPSFLHPAKEPTSVSENEGISTIPSPVTSPVLSRRHYGESITNIGKASILGAASIGKGLGGMLFSRFGRSSTSQPSETSKDSIEDEKKPAASPPTTTVATQTFPHSTSGFLDSAYFRLQESFFNLPQLLFPENVMQNKDNALVELDHRIDFELREGLVESRYWSAVTSHTAYWSSLDVALFLLTFMYKHEHENNAKPDLDTI